MSWSPVPSNPRPGLQNASHSRCYPRREERG
jgi:hypothetical protein